MANGVRSVSVRLQAEVGNYIQGMQRARSATGDLVNELSKTEQQRQNVQELGTGMAVAGAGMAAGFGLAARAAINWESAWAGVVKTVDGSQDQLATLEEQLRTLATELPQTHGEIAEVAQAAGQLGVAVDDVATFTETMVNLGETTDLASDQAAFAVAQIGNVMSTAPEDVERFGSALVDLGNNAATTESAILEMAQRIAGAGATIGLQETEVLAFSTALASVGIEAEAGGSAISRVMIDIETAVRSGGQQLQKLAEVAGVSAEEFQQAYGEDAAGAIAAFVNGLDRIQNSGQDVFAVLEQLGFTEIELRDALLRLASSGDLLNESLGRSNQAWMANVALAEEAEQRYGTTQAQLEVARNQLNDFAIDMGESFLPAIGQASESLGGFVEMLGSLPEPVTNTVAAVGALTAAVLLAGGTAATAVTRIASYRDALSQLRTEGGSTATAVERVNRGMRRSVVWAGRGAGALAALQIAGAGVAAAFGEDFAPRMDALAEGVARFGREGQAAGEAARVLGEDFEELGSAIGRLAPEGIGPNIGNALVSLVELIPGLDQVEGSLSRTKEQVDAFDQSLANLVRSGRAEAAALAFERLADRAEESGIPIERLRELLPVYTAALEDAEAQGGFTADGINTIGEESSLTSDQLENLENRFGHTGDAGEQAAADMVAAWAEASDEFISLTGAQQDAVHELEQEQQQAAENQGVALEELADEYELTADRIIEELEKQVEAQTNWQQNMIELSQQVPPAVLDELARLGPEAAPLVQALVDGSQQEMNRFVELMSRSGALGGEQFANALSQAGPELAAIADELGTETAAKVAEGMEANDTTVREEAARQGIIVQEEFTVGLDGIPAIVVSTDDGSVNDAEEEINNVARNRIANIEVHPAFGHLYGESSGGVTQRREGGVTAHAQMGLLRDPEIFSPAPAGPARYAFAEPTTGGEAFIPRFGDRQRSLSIADVAAQWHGGRVVTGAELGGPWQWHGGRQPEPNGATGASQPVTNNYYWQPQQANASMRDFEAFQARQDALARINRPS